MQQRVLGTVSQCLALYAASLLCQVILIAAQSSEDELSPAGLIQAVIFEVNDRDLIGYPTPTGYRYCCTKELVPKTKCFQDRLIYQVSTTPMWVLWAFADMPSGLRL